MSTTFETYKKAIVDKLSEVPAGFTANVSNLEHKLAIDLTSFFLSENGKYAVKGDIDEVFNGGVFCLHITKLR